VVLDHGPAGTPKEIIERINGEIADAAQPDTREKLAGIGRPRWRHTRPMAAVIARISPLRGSLQEAASRRMTRNAMNLTDWVGRTSR
jgi:hypothetical protein